MLRLLILTIILALVGSGWAQVRTDWSGRLEARFGTEVTGDLIDTGAAARFALNGEIGPEFFPTAAFRTELRANGGAAGAADVRLDEAWLRLFLGDAEVTVGNQRVFWGSADGVNPLDRLNPRDLSVPPDAEKLPVPMIHVRGYLERDLSLEAALIPVFLPSYPPGERWREEPAFAPPPGAAVAEIRPLRDERPQASVDNLQFGVRAQWRPPGFDVALSYLRLFRDVPTVSVDTRSTDVPGEVIVQPVARYDRLDVIGIDGSVALGDVVLRGEAAAVFTADPGGIDPAIGNPSFQVVAGIETLVPDGPRLVVQTILDGAVQDASTSAAGEVDLGLRVMTVASRALDARTDVQAAWVHDLDGSGMLRPDVSHTFADGVTGIVGASVAYGHDGTRFGRWRDRSRVTVSLRIDY